MLYFFNLFLFSCSTQEREKNPLDEECEEFSYRGQPEDIPQDWIISIQDFIDKANERNACFWHDGDDASIPFGEPFEISFSLEEPIVITEQITYWDSTPSSVDPNAQTMICVSDTKIPLTVLFSQNGETHSLSITIEVSRGSRGYSYGTYSFQFGDIALPDFETQETNILGEIGFSGGPAENNGEVSNIQIFAHPENDESLKATASCGAL